MKTFNKNARRGLQWCRNHTSILFLKFLPKAFAVALCILAMVTTRPFAHAESIVGKISSVNGKVQIVRGSKTLAARKGMAIRLHDKVVTGADGSVTIVMSDHNLLHLDQSGTVLIDKSARLSGLMRTGMPDLFSDQ